ncbi:hypothetical protein FB451DRAFT_87447 [Mycena latifolia]|nr:hypothetical protein FB451DRAFT_87447 [Mycena latifolia]
MGDLKVVLKVGYPEPVDGPRSQMALWAEADIYTERLEGIEGVPKLLAKGWLEVFAGQWYPALLMESLGDPIPELDVEDLSPEDKAELDHLQTQLLERGVIHYDVEARNIVRRPNHRLGLVDFGDVVLK